MSVKKRLIALSLFTMLVLMVAGAMTHPGDASGAHAAAAKDGLKTGLNFSWVLYTGALVLFMQAGFALLTTGLTRAKNAGHMMMINFAAFVIAFMGYYVIGFALNFGGVGQIANLGGAAPLNHIAGLGANWGLFGTRGFLLASGHVYDAGTLALFFFEVVFMETAGYIIIGAVAERISFAGLIWSEIIIGALVYPMFGAWVWGGGWLAHLGQSLSMGHGAVDFAGSGVVHMTGGVAAAALAMILGPRIGKFRKDGTPNAIPGHNLTYVVAGTFILLFGWMGFNPGSTLGASDLRISVIAVNTLIASCFGALAAMIWTNAKWGKPDISMACNGMLAGCVAITAGCAFVAPWAAAIIGFAAGFIVCIGVWFFDHKAKIDDPCGAISVHGVCGLFGVLAVGIFADGTYGAGWNGIAGPVRGLLYGDPGQFGAQVVMGVVDLVWAFGMTYLLFTVVKRYVKVRVSADVEIQGLDMPEFGAEAYPEFVLHSTRGAPLSAGVAAPPGEGSISGSKDGKNAGDEPIVFEGSRP